MGSQQHEIESLTKNGKIENPKEYMCAHTCVDIHVCTDAHAHTTTDTHINTMTRIVMKLNLAEEEN